jgi:hypothetical protein
VEFFGYLWGCTYDGSGGHTKWSLKSWMSKRRMPKIYQRESKARILSCNLSLVKRNVREHPAVCYYDNYWDSVSFLASALRSGVRLVSCTPLSIQDGCQASDMGTMEILGPKNLSISSRLKSNVGKVFLGFQQPPKYIRSVRTNMS